jgi:hypothetical protein
MSDTPVTPARPVSLFTIVFIFLVFAAFLLVIRYFYHPTTAPAFSASPDNLTKDTEWRANAATRREALRELREKESKQASSYGWVDQKAGVVHLPIDKAMELTARDLAAKQPSGQNRDLPNAARPKL